MIGKKAEFPFRDRFPNGYAVLAEFLKDILSRADAGSVPIEQWDEASYGALRDGARNYINEMRVNTNATRWRHMAEDEGLDADPTELRTRQSVFASI